MSTLTAIRSFLEPRQLAIAGVSRNPKKFGRHVYEHLKNNGYRVYPVNPETDDLEGEKCYKSIADLPEDVDRIFIVTPPEKTSGVVEETIAKGIKNIWIQQRSETPQVLALLKGKDVNLISNKCIFMFAEPVKGAHSFHRFLSRLFGTYPKNNKAN